MNKIEQKEYPKQRLEICKQCPELFAPTLTCKQCGCFMKIKTQIKNTKCPIGKW